uniref:prolyl 4-hydroxylase subunit alpha-2-like isoform X2 n=1 Tax=Myxine glutinosa TaxID=7769 RepID=UPI00358EE987
MAAVPFLVLVLLALARGDVFSSTGHMAELVVKENRLLEELQRYLQHAETRLGHLSSLLSQFEGERGFADMDPETYVGHPIAAFRLLQRLPTFDHVERVLQEHLAQDFLDTLAEVRDDLPSVEDTRGAAEALIRLQKTYLLSAHNLTDGYMQGPKLTAVACFAVGRVAYSDDDYLHAAEWLEEALHLASNVTSPGDGVEALDFGLQEDEESQVTIVKVLDYLAFSLYQISESRRAAALTDWLLQLDPENERAQNNKKYFLAEMEREGRLPYDWLGQEMMVDSDWLSERKAQEDDQERSNELGESEIYQMLCQGKGPSLPSQRARRLSCYYQVLKGVPLFRFRAEDEWDAPYIVRYYDVLSDQDTTDMQRLAEPLLQRATVRNTVTGVLETADYRVSKSAWLIEETGEVVVKLNRRISGLTGLDLSFAELLQVANYGIGGQYEPHFDFSRRPFDMNLRTEGNRIATFLVYLTDVPAGGATVFPDVGATVWPKKGSAVFWYNMLRSGEGDYTTRHAACPVLVGSKWVANKWLHERGQEFRRPCGLNELA